MTDYTDYSEYDDFEALWGGTPAEAPKGGPLPEGEYEATINSVKMGKTQDGDTRIEWEFKVSGGAYDGRITWLNDYLSSEKIGKAKGHLELFGWKGLSLVECIKRFPELKDRGVLISVSMWPKKDGKLYTHLNGVSDAAPAPEQPALPGTSAPAAPRTTEPDIPFA